MTRKDSLEQRLASSRNFLARAGSPDVLFDHLSDVYFFVKDVEGRFIRVNRAFLDLVHAASEDDVIGARDADFFHPSLAEGYMRDDREVVRVGQAIIDKAELIRNADGSVDWFFTTKLPVFDKSSRTIGVCGITREVKKMNAHDAQLLSWAPVLETIVSHYAAPLAMVALASKVEMSVSQFNRQFRKRFHTTPKAYQKNVRLHAACQLLATTQLTIAEIAAKVGFYDQSHLSAQFTKNLGVSPNEYRVKHGPARSAEVLTLASETSPANEVH